MWIVIWGSALVILNVIVIWLELRTIFYQSRISRLLSDRTFKVSLWNISDGVHHNPRVGRG